MMSKLIKKMRIGIKRMRIYLLTKPHNTLASAKKETLKCNSNQNIARKKENIK